MCLTSIAPLWLMKPSNQLTYVLTVLKVLVFLLLNDFYYVEFLILLLENMVSYKQNAISYKERRTDSTVLVGFASRNAKLLYG